MPIACVGVPSLGKMYTRFLTLNPNDLSGTQGTFAPGHLWFIGDLIVLSCLALPLFLALCRPGPQRALQALAASPGIIYALIIPHQRAGQRHSALLLWPVLLRLPAHGQPGLSASR